MQSHKINQSSCRLLRTTKGDRPFSKDLKDLFATLIVSLLPLSTHRVRWAKVDYTFLSEDAIANLANLKFSQSNRMTDPKEPNRIITTTATTTFSMAKDMARSICQRFLDARFIESADGKREEVYSLKGLVLQLTPKGITVLERFCARNGVEHPQLALLTSLFSTQLITLERNPDTDDMILDQGTIEVIFYRFTGATYTKGDRSPVESRSSFDHSNVYGVKMDHKFSGRVIHDVFTGKAGFDWLMDCSTIVDKQEALEIASLFVAHNLIELQVSDRSYTMQHPLHSRFQPTKNAVYTISRKGRHLTHGAGHTSSTSSENRSETSSHHHQHTYSIKDSNTQRLDKILTNPTLRLLFRENLHETLCEENLSFYQEVNEFIKKSKSTMRNLKLGSDPAALTKAKDLLAHSYGIYNAFLAPGSPRELNIEHQLRKNLASRMTKAITQDIALADTLLEVTHLFEDAQHAVFKLIASDSVPKFLQNPKYEYPLSQAGVF